MKQKVWFTYSYILGSCFISFLLFQAGQSDWSLFGTSNETFVLEEHTRVLFPLLYKSAFSFFLGVGALVPNLYAFEMQQGFLRTTLFYFIVSGLFGFLSWFLGISLWGPGVLLAFLLPWLWHKKQNTLFWTLVYIFFGVLTYV